MTRNRSVWVARGCSDGLVVWVGVLVRRRGSYREECAIRYDCCIHYVVRWGQEQISGLAEISLPTRFAVVGSVE